MPSGFGGLLKGLRGVHILEPLFSDIADEQAVGRGRRNCGHAGLPQDKRNVTVYRYWSVPPKGSKQNVVKAVSEGDEVTMAGPGGKRTVRKNLAAFERGVDLMMQKFQLSSLNAGGNRALYDDAYRRDAGLRQQGQQGLHIVGDAVLKVGRHATEQVLRASQKVGQVLPACWRRPKIDPLTAVVPIQI